MRPRKARKIIKRRLGSGNAPPGGDPEKARYYRARVQRDKAANLVRRGNKWYARGAAITGFGEGHAGGLAIATGAALRGIGGAKREIAQGKQYSAGKKIIRRRLGLRDETPRQRIRRRLGLKHEPAKQKTKRRLKRGKR